MKLVSWNIARRESAWRVLLDSGVDVALLQEASAPPADIAARVQVSPLPWTTASGDGNRPWRTAIVGLSERVQIRWLSSRPIPGATAEDIRVSIPGTLEVAEVTCESCPALFVASLYAPWERPHPAASSNWIYADASCHRLISDLAALIGSQRGHRIIAAGDLNVLHGYGEHGSAYWQSRYVSVFQRVRSLGLEFVGPQAPNGRRADPWPDELPHNSNNVPTYHTARQTPETATRQLDFVFASAGLADQVSAKALNQPDSWGPSDHCMVAISVGAGPMAG